MKKFAKICTFLILILCGVVFAACGNTSSTPILSSSENNVELIIGTDESKSFDVTLSNYGNGSDSVRVESYENDKIIELSTQKIGDGKTRVTVKPLYPGNATIKVSSITHNAKPIEISVKVILPVGDIEFNKDLENSIYVIKGESVDFENLDLINYLPISTGDSNLDGVKTNQIGVTYTLENVLTTDGVQLENGKLVVSSDCALSEIEVRATSIYNAEISKTFKVKILNPISSTVYIDGNKVFENGNLVDGSGNSYAFELYPRESDITVSQKDVLLFVKAGSEAEVIKVEKIFDESKYSVELKSLTYEDGVFKYTYTISALNAGYLENISFKISYKDYTYGENEKDYYVESGNLSVATYNLPNSVLVNGNSSTESGLDILVFENIATISKGTLLEFTLSPSNLAPEYETIRLWAASYANCPISFYKLNSTRTSYELVYGYPRDAKDGSQFVCTGIDQNGNAYFDMPIGTKLYVVKNQMFDKVDNTNATLFASSLNFYNLGLERSKIQLNVKVNPGASSVDRAEYDGTNFTIINSNIIVTEFIDSVELYLAIAPQNFDIGTSSIVKLKNSNIADVSDLKVISKDDNYVYVKFTLTPKKLGATKLTVYLCDGFEKEFELKVISTLDNIDITVSDETESIVDYKETLTGKINEIDENSVTVQKLAFKSGTSIQLAKTAYPISAEYIVEYSFYDLATTKTISELSIKEIFEDASFNTTSNILNADTLSNYSIIQAKTSQSEGKTLIKVDVKGRLATGEGYEEEASHTFYFLIEIYKGVENFDISSNVHEIYSYDTLGDRNADKSFAEFTVTLLSKFGTPTYLNSLELYYGVGAESPIEFNEAGRAVVKYNDKDVLVLTRSLSGNVWTYRVQALTADIQNYVFVLKLVEVDESKIFGGVVRVIVKEAVEITDIEIVNVDLENGIYVENNTLNEEEEGPTFEIKYNIYTKDGSEPLNSGLEFELSSNLSMLGVKIDAQGKITAPAGVGGNGRILIYPSSNYFASSNGMKDGEKPFIEIPISIANGESEETAIRIDSQEKIKYLKQNPTKHYLLVGDFSISETISEFSGGLYGLQNGKTSTLTLTSTMFEKLTGIVKNINIIGEINTQNANLGAICYENYGKIENVNASGLKISNTEAGSHTGALVGVNYGEIVGGEIVATVKGVNVGGVAGLNGTKTENAGTENETTFTGKISGVTFAGNITASGNAGGIVSENNGEISKCKVEKWSNNQSAFIAATSDANGFVGSIAGVSSGKISQTYAYSYNDTMYDITAGTNNNVLIGGLVGQVTGGEITECMTNFSLEGTKIGALVGEITSGNVNNSYTLSKVSSSSASALATDGADKISYSYSRAYYVDGETITYLSQAGGTNVYCAGDYTNLDNFNLALQNNLSNTSLWDTDLSTNNRINQGAAYLVNANPPKAVSSIEININEAGKTKYLYTQEDGKTNIVLYYYQLLEELTDGVAKAELARLNSISLENLFGEGNNLLFNVISSTSISFVGNNIKILGVGKTEVKVTSKYATTTCQEETITFYVIYPIQDFNLYRGSSALNPSTIVKDGDVDQVGMSKTETYSSKVKSTVLLNGQNYSIFTNLFAIGFEIRANNNESSVLGGISSIYDKSHNEGTFDDNFTFVSEGTYTITPKNYNFATDEDEKFSINSILVLQNNGIGTYLGNISEFADFDVINKLISQNFKKNYEIKVVRGASRIQTTLTDSELSPSNVLNFDVVAISDKKQENLIIDIYEGDEIVGSSKAAVENAIFDVNVSRVNSVENNHYFNVFISVKSDVRKAISTTRQFAIKIYDEDKKVVSVLNLTLIPQEVVSISNSHYAANNEVESGFSINTTPTSVLRPGKNGLLAINLYPEYAAYSKIEIESAIINDNYYVLFEQMVAKEQNNYQNASGIIGYSSERDTNKLTIYYSDQLANDGGMVYVRTKIIESVPDGVYFPITIKVYPADETKEIKTSTFVLASETINKAQITVDGKKDAVVSRGNSTEFEISVNEDQELTDIRVLNHDKNSEDNCDYINLIYNRTEYEISNGKKIYKGIINVGLNAELNGDGVVKIQTIMRKTINGKLEEEYDSITLSIVDFTIDGMYIEGNQEDDNVFVAPIQLRQDITFGFKLSKTPTYNSSNLLEKAAVERIESNKAMFLKNIALNVEYSQYLYAINKDLVTFETDDVNNGYSKDISNTENKANIAYSLYYKNTSSQYFDENGVKNSNNYFDIIIDKDESDKPLSSRTFAINGLRTGTIPMQIKIAYTLPSDHNVTNYFTYDFVIKVQTYEDEDTPIAITNEEEFIRYMNATTTESGEPANYILMNDLYLTDFTPIANTEMIASLDGNNKIITIRNFNISSMLNNNANQTLNLALFQTVGEDTTLKNLTINLYELEDIIIDEEKVSNVNAAGLFIDNYGIIYNCEVTALNLWKAYNSEVLASKGISTIEQEDLNKSYKPATYSDGYGIRVYFSAENIGKLKKDSTVVQIAGLGIKNFAAGRITNSRVGNTTFTKVFMTSVANNQSQDYVITAEHLTLLGQADIAGVVLSNEGVIASSFFSNGYITNLAVSGTASKTAGFAIYNAYGGIITGSYVKSFKKASELNGKFYTDGGIYSEGISAGFVYENSSEITDCYANLLLGGSLSGRLVSGFVYSNTNSGNIERCYSAATITGKLTTRMPFSGNNAKGDSMQLGKLTNCYYFVTNYDSETLLEEKYSTGAYAILASLVDRDLLYGFAYTSDSKSLEGSSIDGVWRYTNGEINLSSANSVAISVRYLIENYNGVEGSRRFPYVNEYKYGSKNNPIIIRTADEFNRAFGQETNLKENAYYAISQFYNKNDGTVFGNYRLVSHIDFNNVVNIASTKIASSLMALTGKSNIGGLFDGNGLTISNIEIALSEQENVGLFGQVINGAVFKNANLTVKQVNAGNGVNVGGVVGLVSSSSLINISLEATNLKGENRSEINGKNVVGGIAGLVQGDCKLSNLSSSISVISNYRGENEYKRGQIDCSNLSYAGGIAGIIDIYKTAGESSVSVNYAQVNKLNVSGESIIIEAYYVGGVIGYLGKSTKASDLRFEISGDSNFEQHISSTGNTAGGIVGVNFGDLSEIRIEHEDDVQKQIEDSVAGYYKNSSVKYGHTNLFYDVETTNDVNIEYVGGLVGQMLAGNLINSYSKVDVSLPTADYAGGLIGYNKSNGIFDQVYALGDVDGKIAGGLIGKNEGTTKLSHAVAINVYSKQNSNLLEALNDALNNELTEITIDKIGCIAGEGINNLKIGEEVYANKSFTFNNVKLILSGSDTTKVEKLIISLDEYNGVAQHGTLLNRMFLAAANAWDVSMWAKDDDDMLPYLIFGIVSKVLYIEKPKDFERLWKYSGEGYVVIIGDDPATSFNPYEYKSGDASTYGEFTAAELTGLSVNGNNLYFNLSSIQETFVPTDFKGTIYGEYTGKNYYIGGLTEKSLFKSISGAVVRNIAFGYESENSYIHKSALMAEYIENNALVTNISVKNVTLNIDATANGNYGALVNSVSGVSEISAFSIDNVKFKLNNKVESSSINVGIFAGQLENCDKLSAITIKNSQIAVEGAAYKSASVGLIAGNITGSNSTIKNDVATDSNTIAINATSVSDGELYVGGHIGKAENTIVVEGSTTNYDAIKGLTIDFTAVNEGKVYAGLMFGGTQELAVESGARIIGQIKNGNNAVTAYIGGLAGQAKGIINGVSVDGKDGNLINVNVESTTDFYSSIGGLVGYVSGGSLTITGTNNVNGNISVKNDSEFAVAVGGLVGSIGVDLEINNSSNIVVGSSNSEGNNTIKVESEIISLGGIVGLINQNSATISGTIHVWSIIEARGKDMCVGGIVGKVDNLNNSNNKIVTIGSDNAANLTFNGDIKAFATQTGATLNIGGIVGSITGVNSNNKNNLSKINKVGFKNGSIYVESESTSDIETMNVGGLVGFMSHTLLEGGLVSGNIEINKISITTANIGGVVGQITGGTSSVKVCVNGTKSWGNIKLADDMTIASLYVGGVVGIAPTGAYWQFGSNSTLTSIYNKNLSTGNFVNNVRALVGSAPAVANSGNGVTNLPTNEQGIELTNKYSHMFNLAIDDNSFGKNSTFASIKSDFINENKDLFGDALVEGSKLSPKVITSDTTFGENGKNDAKDMQYYIANSKISLRGATIYANAHLIGNGQIWSTTSSGKNSSPILENYGYISGFKFETSSIYTLTSNDILEEKAPSGVANINNGIIYANTVVVYGNGGSFDKSAQKYSIYAGVVGENNGLIADTGAILYVKNALAGFVANNQGSIINSYVNGVVHNGAMYSFNGSESSSSKILNCYTSIRQGGVIDATTGSNPIFNGGTLKNNFYDRNGTEIEAAQSGVTKKTTSEMSTINNDAASFLSSINTLNRFAQNYAFNFGYPTLSNGAYANFDYLKVSTGAGTNVSVWQIPNVGKLEQIKNNTAIKYVQILTNLDYTNSGVDSHEQINTITYFEGNGFAINNIPENTSGGFFGEIIDDESTDYKDKTSKKTYLDADNGYYIGKYYYLTKEYSAETWGNEFKDKTAKLLEVSISATKSSKKEWWQWYEREFVDYVVNIELNNELFVENYQQSIQTTNKWNTVGVQTHNINITFEEQQVDSDGIKYTIKYEISIEILLSNGSGSINFGGNGGVLCSIYYITETHYETAPSNVVRNAEFNYKNKVIVGSNSSKNVGAVIDNANNVSLINVRSSGATVVGNTSVGGLVGYMNGGAIWNCYNFNDVQINSPSSNECAAGGLVGYAESVNFGYNESNKNGNYGNISISGSGYAGGVIGNSVNCRINYAYNIGNVSSNTFAGGLIGYYSMAYAGANNETLCSHLYNYGIVTSGNCAGGVIGYGYSWNDANEDLQHLFNFGTVKADAGDNSNIDIFAGGIVGAIKVVSTNTISIKYSGNEGSVSGIGKRWVGVGGIVGAHIYSFDEVGGSADTAKNGGSVSDCYNSGNLLCANLNNVDGYVGGIAGGNVTTIENCSMTGKITIRDDETFGWIMGSAWGGATINNCYAEPSTVVVEEKGTDPGKNANNMSSYTFNPKRFYLDYEGGISVYSESYANAGEYETNESLNVFGEYKNEKNNSSKYGFNLYYKMLGNNEQNGNYDVQNVIKINSVNITELALNYYQGNKWHIYHGYVHCCNDNGFLKLAAGYYSIGVYKEWKLIQEGSVPTASDGLSTSSPNSAANLRKSLNNEAHALDWTSNISVTSPDTEDAEITTAEELAYIAANIEDYKATNIKLMNDIDLTGYIWTPIGDYRNGIGLKETIKANNASGWKLRTGSTTWSDLTLNTDYGTLKLCRYNDTGGYNNYEMYINNKRVINQSETAQQSPEREETFTYGDYNWQVVMNGKDWTINIFELSLVGTSFEGSFDGNGYTITGMASFSECFGGLFGNIHHSSSRTYMTEFKNVRILNSVVQSRDWAGSIAGQIAGSSDAVLIYNNIIDCKVYGQENRVGSIVGRLGNTGNGYKAVIALNAVNSNVANYASSDSGAVGQGTAAPKITYTYNYQEYRKWAGIFGALAWRTDLLASNTIKIENAIYKNANLDAESFIKFDDEIFISNIGGQLSFPTTEKVVYDPSSGQSNPQKGNKRWTQREITFGIKSVNEHTSNISDYVGNDFGYSYNGSNSSSNIIRYDNNLKEFFAQYEFMLKVFDQGQNIFDLKYVKNTSYSFEKDIKLHLLTSGDPIIGYKLNNSETLTEDTLRYADIKNYVRDGVIILEIVRSDSISTIDFYIGSNENPAKIYMYEFDESGNIVFTDYNETSNPTDLYVPDGRSGYWVDQNGKKFTKENIKEGMGSFALYWIDDESSSGTPKYSLSDYFYTITFDLNDGSGNFEDCYILKGDEYELPDGPTPPSGKVFVGWSDGSTTYTAGATIKISSDTTLTAQYENKTYNISFEAGEGSGNMAGIIQTSTTYILPVSSFTAPSGKTFAGWLVNDAAKSDGSYYQPGEEITLENDITLKAAWKEIDHTISIYIPVEGKLTIKNDEETTKTIDGVEYTVSISDNYIIISYAYALETDTSSDNYNKSVAGALPNSSTIGELLGLVQVDGKAISLTSFENYVVLGGIKGNSDAVLGANVGDSVTSIPSGKVGNAKVGIYGTIKIDSSEPTLDESSYFRTISYTFNGNTIYTQTFSKEYEIQEKDIPTELSKQGYNFIGYGEDGTKTRAEVATYLNENATATEYQVKFELINYTVTYNGNGGSGSVDEGTYSIENTYIVAANEFTNPGYKFVGWNTSSDGLGTSFNVGDSIGYYTFATPNNITLYAQWEEITLTIVFEPGAQGSGTNPETKYLHYGESITLPANPYDCSWYYEFAGWKCNGTNYTAGATFDFDNSLTDDATYTFTAQWEARELTIKFNNAGTMSDDKFTYPDKGGNYTLPECEFARTGYSFAGWSFNYVYEDGGNYYSITKVANVGEVIGLANMFANLSGGTISYVYEITLTATWTAKYNYQIVVNPNSDAFSGLALASYNPITSTYNSEALEAGTTISEPGFVVTSGDYELIGYAYSLGATSVELALDATINFATFFTGETDGVPTCATNVTYDEATKTFTLTLYAVWGINSAE
ncbi:MAG: InlB B-repeat-containing protein [Firmicutes bacterium]|nr:InlB B-repeat-containing protein [Bacillota bacterium]